jgi:hypothetical protein
MLFRLIILISTVIALGANGLARQNSPPAGFMPVKYCDLIKHPEEYDGKQVMIEASYRYMFEVQELFCLSCRERGKTWLEFGFDVDEKSHKALKKGPNNQGTLNGTFFGTFHSSGGRFGDGGYSFKLDLKYVYKVEVISKEGWDPKKLSNIKLEKLCQ